jgi:hypothetical protein
MQGLILGLFCFTHARDQWFLTYKLRICEIWASIHSQNHFRHVRIRTLIFPSMQSLSDIMHYCQRDIFRKKLTKFDPWCPAIKSWYKNIRQHMCNTDFLCCVSVVVDPRWHIYTTRQLTNHNRQPVNCVQFYTTKMQKTCTTDIL